MFDSLEIQSSKGPYQVDFNSRHLQFNFTEDDLATSHFIIDSKVASIYQEQLKTILTSSSTASILLIEATEKNKSLEAFSDYIAHLVSHNIRKDHRLVAIGGGIIQDITCFIAATILRGVDWWYYPTTLLAQADSCIGSKSSVNCANVKNILGTFTPPKKIVVQSEFLSSLNKIDMCSGIGEMLKVHAIAGQASFDEIAANYNALFTNRELLINYIRRSLEIKKAIIEIDEFDTGTRKVMNYGHTFGHAIESATQYVIPHGIAVTIGMDMANYIAGQSGAGKYEFFVKMHSVLKQNYYPFIDTIIPVDEFIAAISRDKKNKGKDKIGVVLPDLNGMIKTTYIDNNQYFKTMCMDYLSNEMLS